MAAIDRTKLTQPTRLVLLEDFEQRTTTWAGDVDLKVDKLVSRLDVLGAKLGVYAALGACIGGGAVTGVIAWFFSRGHGH